jgi:ketosteroid isomerase-like protein
VVRSYFTAVDAGDLPRLLRCFHEDVTYERPGYPTIHGLERLRHFYAEDRVVGSGMHRVDGVLVDGLVAAAWGQFVGRSRSGEPLDEGWCDVYRFVGARIGYRRTHFFRPAI